MKFFFIVLLLHISKRSRVHINVPCKLTYLCPSAEESPANFTYLCLQTYRIGVQVPNNICSRAWSYTYASQLYVHNWSAIGVEMRYIIYDAKLNYFCDVGLKTYSYQFLQRIPLDPKPTRLRFLTDPIPLLSIHHLRRRRTLPPPTPQPPYFLYSIAVSKSNAKSEPPFGKRGLQVDRIKI